MFVRLATCLVFGTALFLAIMWGTGLLPAIAKDGIDPEPETREVKPSTTAKRDIGVPLYAMASAGRSSSARLSEEPRGIAKDPIVISNSHTGLISKEEVPSPNAMV